MRTEITDRNGAIAPELLKNLNSLLKRLRGQRKAITTLDQYSYALERFGAFLTSVGATDGQSVAMEMVIDYWMTLIDHQPRYEQATLQRAHTVIGQVVTYLLRQGNTLISQRDVEDFEELYPRRGARYPKCDWRLLTRLINDLAAERTPPSDLTGRDLLLWWRKRAIYALLFCTAVRVSELCRMNRVDMTKDYIDILGKGDKAHRVFISETAHYFAHGYLAARGDAHPALFITHDLGRAATRLGVRGVQRITARDGGYYGIADLTPHKLRHLAAKLVLEETGNMELVRAMLNHASINTTQIYAHITEDYYEATVLTRHPAFRHGQVAASRPSKGSRGHPPDPA